MNMIIELSGLVEEIIYKNEENGYTVCEIDSVEDGMFTATGYMPTVNEGDNLVMRGEWFLHHEYGEQFKVVSYETVMPADTESIYRYLATGVVRGVREATAKKLVKEFGEKTLDIMLSNPLKMSEIKGISMKKAISIGEEFAKIRSMQSIVMFLQGFGISANLALKVHKILGHGAVDKIKENPYILSDMVEGITFKTADNIAFIMGRAKNSIERIRAGIKYMLSEAAYSSGHTYLPKDTLLQMLCYHLDILTDEAENGISSLVLSRDMDVFEIESHKICALKIFSVAEDFISKSLLSLAMYEQKIGLSDDDIENEIRQIEEDEKIKLAPEQQNAVITAIKQSSVVITGGPGTGKTTTINTIIKMFKKMRLSVALAAPTGRAAKRMGELTGIDAKTIHRLLGVVPDSENYFVHNETNTLSEDVIIIDEVSMIDVNLMSALLKALKKGARLILSGDADQLPSVGPGNVLGDIIASEKIPVIRLETIFRQAQESMIVINAHKINKGEMPHLDIKDKDFFFLKRAKPESINDTIVDLYKIRLPGTYNINPITSIQVLSPTKKGFVGSNQLNADIQKVINPPNILTPEYTYGKTVFRVGDKVMQNKNNYDIPWTKKNGEKGTGIFNGDMGIITAISAKEKVMTILFDEEREVEYLFAYLDELELSYAITVHKSQGSEFGYVIIPISNFAPALMFKNLLYTAVTRAKTMVILVGREDLIAKMVVNTSTKTRYTTLYYRMREI